MAKKSTAKKGVEFKGERTKVLNCSCAHPFQDSSFGYRKRVHNRCIQRATKAPGWRCSVCDAEKGDA